MRGDRLLLLRQERRISQRELGAVVLVSGYTISAYEQDRCDPSDDIKKRLAEYFDVSLDYLMGLIDQPLSYRRDANVVMLPRTLTEAQKAGLRLFLSTLEDQNWASPAEEQDPGHPPRGEDPGQLSAPEPARTPAAIGQGAPIGQEPPPPGEALQAPAAAEPIADPAVAVAGA